MKKLCVLSGKGGVGKSTVAASLAVLAAKKMKIVCADCDVDASNLALVLGARETGKKAIATGKKAKINSEKCVKCGKCLETCYFGAVEKKQGAYHINSLKCEGCGACALACPQKAIEMKNAENAAISTGKTVYGFEVVTGQLKMGESGSGKVVAEVKKEAEKRSEAELMVIDSAAGIGGPVIASVTGSDFVLAVTEPTPSGLADLERALGVVMHFGIPFALVINKHDLNPEKTREIKEFAEQAGAGFVSLLPYDKAFVDSLVELKPIVEFKPSLKKHFEEIAENALDSLK